jgi:hypothetical protein
MVAIIVPTDVTNGALERRRAGAAHRVVYACGLKGARASMGVVDVLASLALEHRQAAIHQPVLLLLDAWGTKDG